MILRAVGLVALGTVLSVTVIDLAARYDLIGEQSADVDGTSPSYETTVPLALSTVASAFVMWHFAISRAQDTDYAVAMLLAVTAFLGIFTVTPTRWLAEETIEAAIERDYPHVNRDLILVKLASLGGTLGSVAYVAFLLS